MGALSPLFLVAGLAAGVPLFLHLFHRQEVRRVPFPALRYLERTEREHAKRIRLRQLLLLLTRVAVVLALVGAGARLFLRGGGAAHPPTALALILDNSVSSGVVLGGERRLDRLRDLAVRTLDAATEDDRIWVLRAGEPWEPAVPGSPAESRQVLTTLRISAGAADLSEALGRAARLVGASSLDTKEIHLLSDLQRTAFDEGRPFPAGEVPVVVWAPRDAPPLNRALTSVLVGGGLPPLQGQRSQVAVTTAPSAPADTVPIPLRVVLDDAVRGGATVVPGASVSLPLPPAPGGWVRGYVDADPDALRADDRRFFTFRARPAPHVALAGDPGIFTREALSVLEAAGRVVSSSVADADVVISAAAEGLGQVGPGDAVLVLPPDDPTRLPAINRRLASEGIPWRLERSPERGEADVDGSRVPEPLAGVRVRSRHRLVLAVDPPAPTATLGHVGGEPWLVSGSDSQGRRYLLLGSALTEASSTLPVSAGMVRFVDWFVSEWGASGGGPVERVAGDPLPAPRDAERVRLPSGAELAVDGTRVVAATGEAGFYTFFAGDTVVAVEAVNPPAREADLALLDEASLETRIGSVVTSVGREGAWTGAIFRARQGPELWWGLLALALILLLTESALAAAGPSSRRRPTGRSEGGAGGAT